MPIYLVGTNPDYLRDAAREFQKFESRRKNVDIFLGADSSGATKHSDVRGASESLATFNRGSRLRCLLSFHYYRKVDIAKMFPDDVPEPIIMADSGAFSAATLGVSIELDDYVEWLKLWRHRFSIYANLDVIGDPKKTLENQRRLEDKGFNPLPVFHVNEPWEYLEYYLDNYDYIALGGLVPHSQRLKALMPWLIKAFKMLPPGKGYHGFGVTGWDVLKSFPWTSVDSTSWNKGYRYGNVPLFSPVEGKFVTAVLADQVSCYKYRHLFEYCGFDWKDFGHRKKGEPVTGAMRGKIAGVSAISYLRAEEWLRKRHKGAMETYLSILPGGAK